MTNWWIWERPSKIHIIYTAAISAMHPLKVETGACYARILYGFFNKGMIRWMCDKDELIANGKSILPNFLDDKKFKKIKQRWNTLTENLLNLISKIRKTDLSKLSDKELLQLYSDFDNTYLTWWGLTQVAELISYGGEDILQKKFTKEQYKKYFHVLVTPTKDSYSNEEENEIFEIVKLAKTNSIGNPKIKKLIKQHAEKYYWLQNSFGGTKTLDEIYLTELMQSHLNTDIERLKKANEERLKKAKIDKEQAIKDLKLDSQTIKLIWLLDEFCYLQDRRKATDMKANDIEDIFCREVSRRRKIDLELVEYSTPHQLKELISGNTSLIPQLKKQKERCMVIINDENNDSLIYTGKEAEKKEIEILGEDKNLKGINEIGGMCASTGRYTGKVRILLTSKDVNKIQKGEVLVTTMTSPDFVPAMKKAGAVITDEGGITSHAAITSRELGIPCIIGTKIATKVLKDGMTVEVKANHGLVMIVK